MLSSYEAEFQFDDRIATCVFSTAGGAHFAIVRIVGDLRPTAGVVTIHYPCSGCFPLESSMQLQPSLCTFAYASDLHRKLLRCLQIEPETPCRIQVRSVSRTSDDPPEMLIANDELLRTYPKTPARLRVK